MSFSDQEVAIRVESISKRYRIGLREQVQDSLMGALAHFVKRPLKNLSRLRRLTNFSDAGNADDVIWALNDVSFEVKRGEAKGIIGRNGVGKSTLLKILSRITSPTKGQIDLYGRVGSLLEVGTGFHGELTGRENVYLNGTILGMSKKEIDRKFDEIVSFSGVEKFIDTPVKRYSSGMSVRLAFSVAAHLEPEIVLIDEVLAVGDIAFREKCVGKMGDVASEGRTILFVSHNMNAIRQLCQTCIWIDNGTIRQMGPSADVVDRYIASEIDPDHEFGNSEAFFKEDLSKDFQLRSVRLLNERGNITQELECDEPVIVEMVGQVHQKERALFGYLTLLKEDGTAVLESMSWDDNVNCIKDLENGTYTLRVRIPPRHLAPGTYVVYLSFGSWFGKMRMLDVPGKVVTFHLSDFMTKRGNQRTGYFSTILPWSAERVV
jgi:lipopolysaccharide transport system ATP-binding protein